MITLLNQRQRHPIVTYNPLLAGYTFLLFSFNTVFVAMNMHNCRLAYIDHNDFPGGPALFTLSRYSAAIAVVPNAAFILSNWLADGLLVGSPPTCRTSSMMPNLLALSNESDLAESTLDPDSSCYHVPRINLWVFLYLRNALADQQFTLSHGNHDHIPELSA